jgi:hypothetical protein
MQRTITAKYVAWPSARFVRPAGRESERRLGLHTILSFQRASTRRTSSRPLRAASADWSPALSGRPARTGIVRSGVTVHWVGAGDPTPASHSSLAPAPWRG